MTGKHLKKMFLLAFLVLSIHILVFLIVPKQLENHYVMTIIDKNEILDRTEQSRIIVAGGSGIALGLDSQLLSQKTGKNVVNYGVHAALGQRLILTMLKPHLQAGDIVIIIPEYENFWFGDSGGLEIPILFESYPPLVFNLTSFRQWQSFFKYYPSMMRHKLYYFVFSLDYQDFTTKYYFRGAANEYGDIVTHLDEPNKEITIPQQETIVDPFDSKNVKNTTEFLNEYAAYCTENGIDIFFVFPIVPEEFISANKENTEVLYEYLLQNLDVKILNTPKSSMLQIDSFYDTVYHPNRLGRERYTLLLYDLLYANGLLEIND